MGRLDWDALLAVSLRGLSPQEIDSLTDNVAACEVDERAKTSQVKHVLSLAQLIIKRKGEQMETLTLELDDLATKHLEATETLRQENSEMRAQLTVSKKSRKGTEARKEIARLQQQIREQQLEIEAFKLRPMISGDSSSLETKEDENKNLNRSLELKTGHISQLLSDLEAIEEENTILKERLSTMKDRLSETTQSLSDMATELTTTQNLCIEYKGQCTELKIENEALCRQRTELVEQRMEIDRQLEEFGNAVDLRVEKWKGIMEQKDCEISELRSSLASVMPGHTSHLQDRISTLCQDLSNREQQVKELSEKLSKATKELGENAVTLEELRLDSASKSGQKETRPWEQLQRALAQEQKLEEQLREVEQDVKSREEELTMVTVQLRQLESGEVGLAESLAEVRELRRQLTVRDGHIEKLVQTTNQLQSQQDELADQNMALRERLGLSSEDDVDTSSVADRRAKEKSRIDTLQLQVSAFEGDKLKLKLENRDLQRQIAAQRRSKSIEAENVKTSEDVNDSEPTEKEKLSELQADLSALIEENESLRKGMHEILDSIRSQDAISDVRLESECLERLLEALDTRHVSGWYHPAMRLQAQLQTTQGAASELREQLRVAREQERNLKQQIIESFMNIEKLTQPNQIHSSQQMSETLTKTTNFQPSEGKVHWSKDIRTTIEEFKILLSELSSNFPVLSNAWNMERVNLVEKTNDAVAKAEEFERHWAQQQEEGTEPHSVALCAARAASQRLAERASLRRCHCLEARCERLQQENHLLRQQAAEREAVVVSSTNEIQRTKEVLSNEMKSIYFTLANSVPNSEMQANHSELQTLSASLRELLIAQEQWGPDGYLMQEMQEKLQTSEEQLGQLRSELQQDRATLRVLQAQNENTEEAEQISSLAQKLAESEQNEQAAKQKADHATKMCNILREQVSQLEVRRGELEKTLLDQHTVTLDLPDVVPPQTIVPEHNDAIQKCERLEEALAISQNQVAALQLLTDARQEEVSALRQQTLDLQGTGDLQATIGRLSEELLGSRLKESNLASELTEVLKEKEVFAEKCKNLEIQLLEKETKEIKLANQAIIQARNVQQRLVALCRRHAACVPLASLDRAVCWMRSAREETSIAREEMARAHQRAKEAEDKLANSELRASAAVEIKDVLGSSGEAQILQIQEWHNRNLQLRLKELESQRQAGHLSEEVTQLQERLTKLEAHSRDLEDQRLKLDRDWEQQQICWEMERGIDKVTTDQQIEKPVTKQSSQKISSAPHSLERVQSLDVADHVSVSKEVLSAEHLLAINRDIEERKIKHLEEEIRTKDQIISQLNTQLAELRLGSRAKLALEAMVASLSELLALKEQTVSRAQQRLKDVHREHAQLTRILQQEIRGLRDAAARMQVNALQPLPEDPSSSRVTVERLLTQVHELEDQLRLTNKAAGTLAGQVRASQMEVQKWRGLAEAKQARLVQLQERYQAEVEEAVAGKLGKAAWNEKSEIEQPEKEFSLNEGPELLKAQQEMQNLRERLGETQLELKALREEMDTYSKLTNKAVVSKKTADDEKRVISAEERARSEALKIAKAQQQMRSKIQQLQADLQASQEREQATKMHHRAKTAEGVARWEEKKQLQHSIDKLKEQVKEKEATIVKLTQSNTTLRSLLERLERDKIHLENQLRMCRQKVTSSPSVRMLEAEVLRLQDQLSIGDGSTVQGMKRQLEKQQRLIETLRLSKKADPETAREIDMLKDRLNMSLRETERISDQNLDLQGRNTRLEATNLELRLKVETMQTSPSPSLDHHNSTETNGSAVAGASRNELQRMVLVLRRHVRKLQARVKAQASIADDSASTESSDCLLRDTEMRLQAALNCKASLEQELDLIREQNTSLSMRLQRKVQVLMEVRATMREAVDREMALKEEISRLRLLTSSS